MENDRLIGVLEEIRELLRQQVQSHQQAVRNQQEAVRAQQDAIGRGRKLQVAIGVVIAFVLILVLVLLRFVLRRYS